MALKGIGEKAGKSASMDADFLRAANRAYLAFFDPGDDEIFVLLNCGYSIHGSHPSDAQVKVLSIEVNLLESAITFPGDNTLASLWEVKLQYGPWNPLEHSIDGNPLNLPVRFRLEFTTAEVAAFEDVEGNPIVNAAGDPYDPPLMREVTRATLIVMRNESPGSINLATLAALSNTLNAETWNDFPPKTVRLAPIRLPEIQYSQVTNTFYFPMEYTFDVNFDTWVKQVVNVGLRQLDSSGNLVPIYVDGQLATTPVPLNASGQAILAPTFKDSGGDAPDGEPDDGGGDGGGGEPPEGGDGVLSDSNLVIDAYDLIRTADFTALDMDSLFTLPTP